MFGISLIRKKQTWHSKWVPLTKIYLLFFLFISIHQKEHLCKLFVNLWNNSATNLNRNHCVCYIIKICAKVFSFLKFFISYIEINHKNTLNISGSLIKVQYIQLETNKPIKFNNKPIIAQRNPIKQPILLVENQPKSLTLLTT